MSWSRQSVAILIVWLLAAVVAGQEPTVPKPTVTVSLAQNSTTTTSAWTLTATPVVIAANAPDALKVCTDTAMTTCVTVADIRAQARAEGELGALDQLMRQLLTMQQAYTTTLSELDACRGQLGPLRAQANQKAVSDQVEAWIADLETRNPGWTYDRQTGALVKKSEPKKGGTP